ncbi:MAG: divalent-cation tolerance protein CutA [Bacteroidota bacterium]
MSNKLVLLTITFPNEAAAKTMAQQLVERRLVACAQLLPIQSIYRWEGAVQQENEVMLQAKTLSSKLTDIEAFVSENHGYDVPEMVATEVVWGHQPYLDWVSDIVK